MAFNLNKYKEISAFITKNRKKTTSIIAVSKTHSVEIINNAIKTAGIRIFGENRVQEASNKFEIIKKSHPNIELHLVGPLQTNKVKKALSLFDYIHTIDRENLAVEISKNIEENNIYKTFFVQVNIGLEKQKSGIAPKDADDFIKYCINDLKLNVKGLMCIPPINQDSEKYFVALKEMSERNKLSLLSMGMSADYKSALLCGATHLRIGSLIFGERNQLTWKLIYIIIWTIPTVI